MTLPSNSGEVRGRAVQTNGVGKPCTSHLNLTRTLADVHWPGPDHPTRKGDPEPHNPKAYLTYERQPKIRFAGAE